MANPFDQFDTPAPAPAPRQPRMPIDADAIRRGAQELGIDPVDLATAISYETAGTFDPDKRGPTTKWGQHQGLIQFGEPQRARYGVRPGMTVAEQMPAVVSYLRDAGVQPGMGMLDVYSAINAGRVGRYNASDALAGGMPGTVADKVNYQMGDHRAKAMRVLGEGGGGGGGGYPAMPSANPFEQGGMPDLSGALSGPNPFDQFDAPDFSNVQTAVSSTEPLRGLPLLPAAPLSSGNGDIPKNPKDRDVGRIYTDKRGVPRRWMGDGWASGEQARETTIPEMLGGMGLAGVQGLTRIPESLLDLAGWLTGGESLLSQGGKQKFEDARAFYEQLKPEAYRAEKAPPIVETDSQGNITGLNMPSSEKFGDVFSESFVQIPTMLYGGGGLKNAAQAALPNAPRLASVLGYGGANAAMVAPGIAEQARTEALQAGATPEQAQEAANKAMALAVPLTTATGGLGEGLAGVQGAGARNLITAMLRGAATEAPTESIEEAGTSAISDIAQGRDVNQANALESAIMAAFGGGIPGAAVAGTEYMGARNRPAAFPQDTVNIDDIVKQAKAILPAVAAEVPASPRQGDAPAAPPTPAPAERQEAPAPEAPPAPVRPDMTAATRAIDNRLAALDETAAQQIDEAEVSALNAERQELDDLVREQDRARREGIVQPLEARLSPEERATADARRQEIAATLERHRAARTAGDQAQRLRSRLESADTDAALYEVAREIDPTLGTPQAEAFRAAPAPQRAPGAVPGPRAQPAAQAPGAVPDAQPAPPVVPDRGTSRNVANVAEQPAQATQNVGDLRGRAQPSAPAPDTPSVPAAVTTTVLPETPAQQQPDAPRAEAQRQPAAEPMPQGQTSVRNAVTDAERIAEGRDPIIREARKANRETVDEAVQSLRETPTLGRETANRLASGGPVELKDEAVLLVHKVDLRKRRDAAAERAQSPDLSDEARATARREYDDLVQQIDEVDQAAVRVGTESGRLLQLRRRMIAEDYSLPALERKLQMVVNRDLKPGERAELKEMADKVADLQRKLDAAESKQAGAQVAEMLARLMKGSPGRGATLEQRRTAAAESRAALSAIAGAGRLQRSIPESETAVDLSRGGGSKTVKIGDTTIIYGVSSDGASGEVISLRTPSAKRGKGSARAAMRKFLQATDRAGMEMKLGASPLDRRTRLGPLVEFYRSLGFELTGRKINQAGEPEMVRKPNVMRSIAPAAGKPGQARDALVDRLGRGVVRQLERDGVLKFEGPAGASWDGVTMRIGDVAPEDAFAVLLHEASHARLSEVLGSKAYDTALRDLDALEVAGDATAVRAARRAARSGETGARLDDERLAYMVEEAAKANRTTGGVSAKARELVRRILSAFRQWAATSPVFRALERIGAPRPTLQPEDFVAFAQASLRRLMEDAARPESRQLRGRIGALETELRTDDLTGMRNKRALEEDEYLGWPVVSAMDMDGMKKLNTAVGHETADKVLKALAETFKAAETDGIRFYRRSGDEFAARFRDPADAERVMAELQQQLEETNVELDVTGPDGRTRSFTYEGIGISYGLGADYELADQQAYRQKAEREASGIRQAGEDPRPSRRLREDTPRPGGRRAGDPAAEVAQRSIVDQTQTPAFKRWFGGSKVVDENGNPRVVYHGANAKFDAFDPSKIGSLNGRSEGAGFYFTTDKTVAKMYEERANDGALYEVYLRIEKPMAYDTPALPRRKVAALLAETARQEATADEDLNDWRDGFLANYVYTPDFRTIEAAAMEAAGMFDGSDTALDQISGIIGGGVPARIVNTAVQKALGFDGYVATGFSNAGTAENTIYVAMQPEQIKSATANRGTFDPADPNIMRSIPEGPAVPAGVDPVAFFHLARMGAFHYADGAQDQAEWTRRMQADLGAASAQYRDALPAAFEAAKAQASRPARGAETVAEAMEAIGDKRRPRDVKRVVRAAVNEGMRGEGEVFQAAAQALDMDEADVRALFVQPEPGPKTLSEAQAEINRLRKALRDAQRPDPETRYQNQRARDFERRIAELEQRIADGDFAKRERVERELSKENERLRFELEKAKERFHQRAIEAEFEQRSPLGKIFGESIAGVNFARAVMTSLDLSGVFRQGGFITLGNPTRAAKAVPDMLRAFVSERADFRAREELQNRPNAPLYKKAGLQLTGIGGDALSRTEEAYASRWVDKWSRWAGGGLIRGSGRSYTAFLNRLRADSFDAMVAALARNGSNPTTEEIKAIANYVNVATGRGKIGTSENVGEALTAIFFAPRLVASRFQLLAGQPLYGGSNRTRKMIAQEYARFLMGVSVAIALAAMMRDEDDETKPIEMDPRSANFGKVRFGDTFLDPLAGLAQVTTFLARVGSGETRTTSKGELLPLRDEYRLTDVAPGLGDGYDLGKVGYGGRDIPDVVTNFLRSKLAPVPGAILNVATGKNMIGEEATPLNQAVNLVTPMSVGNLVDVMEAHGMARGAAINLLGILGMSVQYRKGEAEKAAEEQNGIPGKLGFGTAEDLE